MEQIEMTEEKWFEEYKPVPNHFDPNASWHDGEHGYMFETYGEEQDYIYAHDYKHVWTYMDVDNGSALVAGRHFVNRIGYFITEKPWESGEEYVQVDEYEEEMDEDDEMEEDE